MLFQSSVQHFALAPNNLDDAPSWAVDFMKEVPTTWDETRFIDGYPGRYVIMARRSGAKWYVAGINAQDEPVKMKVSLPMVTKGLQATFYTDDDKLQGSCKETKVKSQQVTVNIPKNGGMVVVAEASGNSFNK